MAGPIFNEFGALVGILSNNTIIGPGGAKIAFVREGGIFSHDAVYLGRLVKSRGTLVWINA